MCGDATNAGDLRRLMGSEKARMVFTDPPYNVPIDGHVSGLGTHPTLSRQSSRVANLSN